jgi:hypothetical protein
VVEDSTIAHNTVTGGVGLGGGIASNDLNGLNHESTTVLNSTIADNSVSAGSKDEGGAIFNGTTLTITNSTIAGNSAPSTGGALAGSGAEDAGHQLGVTELANTIVSYNKGKDCGGRTPTSLGGNIADDTSCALASHSDKVWRSGARKNRGGGTEACGQRWGDRNDRDLDDRAPPAGDEQATQSQIAN